MSKIFAHYPLGGETERAAVQPVPRKQNTFRYHSIAYHEKITPGDQIRIDGFYQGMVDSVSEPDADGYSIFTVKTDKKFLCAE